jgi:pilus assembly protein CpaB
MLRLVLLLFALLSGAAAAWLVVQHGRPPPAVAAREPTQAAPAPPTQDVLIASSELRPAQPLSKENMRWQRWPEDAVNPVYITRSNQPDALETLSGSLVRNRISLGEPIREENLAPRNAGFLAAILPAGKRAVAVRISAENTAGGFILPNDRVDVLHTEGEEQASRTILRNIPILAIDQIVDEKTKDEKGKATVIGKTATLELDPIQAEILTAAQAKGTLSLSLRSAADNDDNRQQSSKIPRIIRAGRSEMVKTHY